MPLPLHTWNPFNHLWDCATFWTHIQNFTITAAILFHFTCQESEYTSGTLPKASREAFETLQNHLCQEPTLAFPRADRQYAFITNTYHPTQRLPRGPCKTVAQINQKCHLSRISATKGKWKNYSPFYWNSQPQSGGWTIITNTWNALNSSYSLIWCTPDLWTGYLLIWASIISLFKIDKDLNNQKHKKWHRILTALQGLQRRDLSIKKSMSTFSKALPILDPRSSVSLMKTPPTQQSMWSQMTALRVCLKASTNFGSPTLALPRSFKKEKVETIQLTQAISRFTRTQLHNAPRCQTRKDPCNTET